MLRATFGYYGGLHAKEGYFSRHFKPFWINSETCAKTHLLFSVFRSRYYDFGIPNASLAIVNAQEFGTRYNSGLVSTTKFLVSRGVPREMVPDVAQAAWLLAWERLNQLRDDSKIVSWVNTIALNQARREIAKSHRFTELAENYHPTVGLNIAAIDLDLILRQCKPYDRTLLEAELAGVVPEEIAPSEGITNSGMRVRFFRARRAARDIQKSRTSRAEAMRFEQIVSDAASTRVDFAQEQINIATGYTTLAARCSDHANQLKLLSLSVAALAHAKQTISKLRPDGVSAWPELASQLAKQERRISELANRSECPCRM